MFDGATRDARRTERYLDGLMAADERRANETPMDLDLDPAIGMAARQLRADLVRVHPSFRFDDALAARLAAAAARMQAGLPAESPVAVSAPATIAAFPGLAGPADSFSGSAAKLSRSAAAALGRLPDVTAQSRRPLIVGGVGVASAAISLGAVYVAWRHSHPASGRMSRAVRAAHGRSSSGRRRSGVINGILGVVS
jgi:hypothetical protein